MKDFDFDIFESEPIGIGSNSKVYCCNYQGKNCVVKVPLSKEKFISSIFQVDSIKRIYDNGEPRGFTLPHVLGFFASDSIWGELVFMDKIDKIYPLDILLNNGMADSIYVINKVAEAIATLHNVGISGYDVEFYWSYDFEKVVLLDIGPSFTINTDAHEMVYQHFMLAKRNNNYMAMWNLVSELFDSKSSKNLFSDIIEGKMCPSVDDLIDSIKDNSEYLHVASVARNHYLQILSCCDNKIKGELVDIFIRRYIKVATIPSLIYIQAFKNSFNQAISSSQSFLYYSKYKAISKMSNTVQISEL